MIMSLNPELAPDQVIHDTSVLRKGNAFPVTNPVRLRNAAKALIRRKGHVLVVEHKDAEGLWHILPGGALNPGESLHEALLRECREEIGSSVLIRDLLFVREYIADRHPFFSEWTQGVHHIDFIFECDVPDGYDPANVQVDQAFHTVPRWLELRMLPTVRFYPQILADLLLSESSFNKVYLGDSY